jgi:galactokinase
VHDDSSTVDPAIPLEPLVQRAREYFRSGFGRPPRWLAGSPGRVNLIGEHTDYNDGFVLPLAIDRHVVLAADRRPSESGAEAEPTIRIRSSALGAEAHIPIDGASAAGVPRWASYVRGVVAGMSALGIVAGPLDILIETSLPLGGGLSSSAALEVATATLVEAVTGRELDPLARARLCQKAEQEAAGVPCGIMDQFSTIFGRTGCALLLDCRTLQADWVPLADPAVALMVVNSGVKHALADGAYAERRAQCTGAARALNVPTLRDATLTNLDRGAPGMDPLLRRRARHVLTENDRTVRAAAAIRASDWPEVGRLMNASHASLRDDYEVSCAELDWLVDRATATPGVFGARMTGGGFGGCIVALVRSESEDEAARAIVAGYRPRFGVEAAPFRVRPVGGACSLPVGSDVAE